MAENEKHADALFVAIEGYIAKRFAALERQVAELVGRLTAVPDAKAQADVVSRAALDAVASLPKAEPGKSITPEDVRPMLEDMVARAFAALPKPESGKSVTIDDVRPLLQMMVDAIPRPKDGASVTEDDVAPMIQFVVDQRVRMLPVPADGKSVTLEQVHPLIVAEVKAALSDLPRPKDGGSVTIDDVRPVLAEMVAALPKPQNGKDASPDAIAAEVARQVALIPPVDLGPIHERYLENLHQAAAQIPEIVQRCVDALPAPKDGASVTLEDIRPLIEHEVALIPPAEPGKPGKDADVDYVRIGEMIGYQVAEQVARFPVPKDGESVHIDTVRVMVAAAAAEEVAKQVALIPSPENGKDADPAAVAALVNAEVARQFEILRPHIKGDAGDPGFTPDDFEFDVQDGGRTISIRMRCGDRVLERTARTALPVSRGVYVKGAGYLKGDVVTYGGSAFISERDTSAPIGGNPPSPDWRMLVQRGRDA